MIRRSLALSLAALAIACAPAAAGSATRGDLTLSDPQVRASLGVNPNTAGYLTIENRGPADELLGASCACAARVELHLMSHTGGVMRMDKVASLIVPAGGRLELRPNGSAHLMLIGTKAPLKAGTEVRMTLRFRRAGTVTTNFHVTATPGAADHAGH